MFIKSKAPVVLAAIPDLQVYDGTNLGLIGLLLIGVALGVYALIKLIVRRARFQRRVLEKKVEIRTSEISEQKEELQKQSEALKKAYLEIKTKNMAIEEAFEHLTNSYARLSDVNREKDGIISIVAHDLRTPLNNIEGLIQLVSMDGNLTEDQKDYIAKIRTLVQRGNEMIRDLLDINQSKNQQRELSISSFKMVDFIESWKANFEKPLSTKNQTFDLSGDYKAVELLTDAGLLSRILDNLMSNAIKFSEKEKTIKMTIDPFEDQVRIVISDEGPGISEEDKKKMFKPFTRLTAQPTNGEPSNGLGLSIIKNLSKQLGGKVEVSSEVGKGTSFTVTIPVKAKQAVKEKSAAS